MKMRSWTEWQSVTSEYSPVPPDSYFIHLFYANSRKGQGQVRSLPSNATMPDFFLQTCSLQLQLTESDITCKQKCVKSLKLPFRSNHKQFVTAPCSIHIHINNTL